MFDFLSSRVMSCASFYFSTGSWDKEDLTVVLGISCVIALVISLIVVGVIFNVRHNRSSRDDNKPLQTIKGAKIMEKKETQEIGGPMQYTVDFGARNRIVLYAFEDALRNLVVGDIVDITYRGDTLKSYQFPRLDEETSSENSSEDSTEV